MRNYVTLFDKNYLPQGLTLYYSLAKHSKNFTLWVICIDQITFDFISFKSRPDLRPILLSTVENQQLVEVKKTRTKGEYCWTLTPFCPQFIFDLNPDINEVTYIDADLYFLKDLEIIHTEFEKSNKSVLITQHGFYSAYDKSSENGYFCVQFMIFKREGSKEILDIWQQQCIEWCYARAENGRFGDQKYLDTWPTDYPSQVHVLSKPELTQAPWNAMRYPHSEAVLYHFHDVRLSERYIVRSGNWIPAPTLNYVYSLYFRDLRRTISELKEQNIILEPQRKSLGLLGSLAGLIVGIYRHVKQLNLYHQFKL
ncbi:glycosyl transferase [Chitinibacter sp. SCUT-21]|uniref:glycosyltransferase n=1 Tax=Chitinibacter sp. SCUT-21 TaxID=2970891 RepID=UPI0035A70F6A